MFDLLLAGDVVSPFFILLTLVLSSVVVVSLLLARAKQSLLVGYFISGVILANSGVLEWAGVANSGMIDALSEVGVVLLLFTLGVEFSIGEMKALRRPVLLGGGIQVGLCVLIGLLAGLAFDLSMGHALLVGFVFSLSSTAVSMKSFQELGLPDSPQARVALGMAIFQDLAAILFMVLLPTLLTGESGGAAVGMAAIKGLSFTAGIVVLSRHGFPQMLDAVAKTRSRELFTVTVVGLCATVALVSGVLGLSPALGAFAAGVVVSESIYSHRVLADVLPFKDLFLTVFFVSVGLLVDIGVLLENWLLIVVASVALVLVKGGIVAMAARLSGLRMGSWMTTAAALSSTGEFSIVLLNRAGDFNALDQRWEQVLLASTAITMGLVPTLMKQSVGWVHQFRQWKMNRGKAVTTPDLGLIGMVKGMHDHIIICGYGPVGRNLHDNLQRANIRVIVLELNPETVKQLMREGVTCLFADARDREALEVAHVERARGIAFTFPDEEVVASGMRAARELNPQIVVFARAKFAHQAQGLIRSGVDHVMYDEEQSGRALIRSVMHCYSASVEEQWYSEG